jgi:hypothetical protein
MATEEDRKLEQLEILLQQALAEVAVVDASDEAVGSLIMQQLTSIGIALVTVGNGQADAIRRTTGAAMADTFKRVSAPAAAQLRQGNFQLFSEELNTRASEDLRIALKSGGFLNHPPIAERNRGLFLYPRTNTIHNQNPLVASNNLAMWELLIAHNPNMAPERWFRSPLKPEGFRHLVTEDGVKVVQRQPYTPTALHYDGQLGQGEGADARRIQIVYTSDTGPVRLFVVPGSHRPTIRALIQSLTRTEGTLPGFVTLKKSFAACPRLGQLLYKYGVAVPGEGLLMFRANVWHYEAAEAAPVQADQPVRVHLVNGQYDPSDTAAKTRISTVFRVYCGVVSVPPQLRRDCLEMAFLREHHWPMEPFASQNKRHQLFVNEKSTQFWKVLSAPDARAWLALRNTSFAEMQHWLNVNTSDQRLTLYGLSRADLLEPIGLN